MTNVLVTGAYGQLSSCIADIAHSYPELNFVYKSIDQLDITDRREVEQVFAENQYDFCINCAAYTAVDLAESNIELAFKVNAGGAANLAEQCSITGCVLIHISTDFVFDGSQRTPSCRR